MNYANFQRTISLYKVLKISNIKALKTDSFFEQIFIPILNTLPNRESVIDRQQFDGEKSRYWQDRFKAFSKEEIKRIYH